MEKIIVVLRAVPPILLPLVPIPATAMVAVMLEGVVQLALHSLGA